MVNATDEVAAERAAMMAALEQAEAAGRLGNVPVGAVVVVDGEIVARAGNRRDTLQDPTAHAELLALRAAARSQKSWRLEDATLVVTLEPCAMCAGAIAHARVGRLVYGAAEPKTGAVHSQHQLLDTPVTKVTAGVLATRCQALLQVFFEALRQRP
ncbi:MAG: nucleoside deaminase [Myxococcota bacterium]|jgi:tRNA(adenine34) deaminase|nr:nucleoside deaminase [Myxococcota bacterium]